MLDIRFVRTNTLIVKEALAKRNVNVDIDQLLYLDRQRREKLTGVEELKNRRNIVSREIGKLKSQGHSATDLVTEMGDVSQKIKNFDEELKTIDQEMADILMVIPNIPHESVPLGEDDSFNREERTWKQPTEFSFEPQAHWELGEKHGILDFERAAKVAGARFVYYKGWGAALERALVNFMLDTHTFEHNYLEVLPPFMVNRQSMTGTGQLPKFEEDLFKINGTDYYLIPTAEVPVTNIHQDEILEEKDLPLLYCAYSPCFRSEAGAYGRDTRGLIRQHQFNKVELVKFAHPDNSYEELEKLTADAEKILQLLELPYRVVTLATGDLGFSAAKTYDLEVWLPNSNTYREISSCSNFEDFQARRANIRFKGDRGRPQFVHTLNGSGLAIGRTTAAIIENYQQEDGTIKIPQVLQKYMGSQKTIK